MSVGGTRITPTSKPGPSCNPSMGRPVDARLTLRGGLFLLVRAEETVGDVLALECATKWWHQGVLILGTMGWSIYSVIGVSTKLLGGWPCRAY
jgi:hypothetical protein